MGFSTGCKIYEQQYKQTVDGSKRVPEAAGRESLAITTQSITFSACHIPPWALRRTFQTHSHRPVIAALSSHPTPGAPHLHTAARGQKCDTLTPRYQCVWLLFNNKLFLSCSTSCSIFGLLGVGPFIDWTVMGRVPFGHYVWTRRLVIFINVWRLEANLQWQEGSIKLRLSTF